MQYYGYKNSYTSPYVICKKPVKQKTGHITMYSYDEELYKYFLENNKSLNGFALTNPTAYSDTFYVDFDDNDDDARKLYQRLKKANISFLLYNSGGRSKHFHISRGFQVSKNLPYSDKLFAKDNIPGCDLAIYRHTGTFRMPGTVHETTGKEKVLLESNLGNPITVPVKERPILVREEYKDTAYDKILHDSFIKYAIWKGFEKDQRNHNMFKLIKVLSNYKVNDDTIRFLARCVNEISSPPMEDTELETLFRYHLGGN